MGEKVLQEPQWDICRQLQNARALDLSVWILKLRKNGCVNYIKFLSDLIRADFQKEDNGYEKVDFS
jgi:hypothetical protein